MSHTPQAFPPSPKASTLLIQVRNRIMFLELETTYQSSSIIRPDVAEALTSRATIIERIVGEMKKELAKLMRRAMAAEDRDQIVEDLTYAIVEDLTTPKTSYFKASAS